MLREMGKPGFLLDGGKTMKKPWSLRRYKCGVCRAFKVLRGPSNVGFEAFTAFMQDEYGWTWDLEHHWVCRKCNDESRESYETADALLAEREKSQESS